jgi:hypothetical protein
MPFRIDYTGPANVTTYFHVESENQLASQSVHADTSLPPQRTDLSELPGLRNEKTPFYLPSLAHSMASVAPHTSVTSTESNPERFVAKFRGRIVRGKRVYLPQGYTGLVLKNSVSLSSQDLSRKQSSIKKTRIPVAVGRATRQTTRATKDVGSRIIEADMEEEINLVNLAEETEAKLISPASKFTSITLWNPDIHADEGKDEYIRFLREWTLLASEVRYSPVV